MSIQAITAFVSKANGITGTINIAYAKLGDKVVSVQAISNNSAFGVGEDMSSYFASSISTDGEIEQTSSIANGNLSCLAVLARGV